MGMYTSRVGGGEGWKFTRKYVSHKKKKNTSRVGRGGVLHVVEESQGAQEKAHPKTEREKERVIRRGRHKKLHLRRPVEKNNS